MVEKHFFTLEFSCEKVCVFTKKAKCTVGYPNRVFSADKVKYIETKCSLQMKLYYHCELFNLKPNGCSHKINCSVLENKMRSRNVLQQMITYASSGPHRQHKSMMPARNAKKKKCFKKNSVANKRQQARHKSSFQASKCFPLSSKSLSELSLELSHLLVCVSLPVLSLDGQLLGFLLGQQLAGRWQLLFQLLHYGCVPLHTQTANRLGGREVGRAREASWF